MAESFDIVIIGSGISSLTCAAILAKRGKSVLILEQHSKIGGYLHCFNRFGSRYDTGAHYVGAMESGQAFHTLLKYLDVLDEDDFIPLDPNGFDVLKFPSFSIELPKGYEATIERLGEAFPSERAAIRAYFEKVQAIVRYFPTYAFTSFDESGMPAEALDQSLAAVVSSLTQNTDLQCVLYAHCALHGVAPEDVSFGLHSIITDSLIRGPYGFKKGGDALAEKSRAVIERNGGKIITRCEVTKLDVRQRQVSRVECAMGSRTEAFEAREWVISGIHPKATFRLISEPVLTPAFRDRLENLRESVGLFGLYAMLDQRPASIDPLKNYFYFASSDPRVYRTETSSFNDPQIVFMASARRQGSPDQSGFPLSLHAAGPLEWFAEWQDSRLGRRPAAYNELKDSFAQRILHLVGRYEPEIKAAEVKYASSTPLTNLFFNGSEAGSAFGIYHSIPNTGPRAIGPRTKVLNLLLTGQSSLFPGLLGAAVSALRTAGHIVGIKPMLGELKELAESV